MADRARKILPHGEPKELMPGVWTVTGDLPFPLRRVMTIVRLTDGSLLLHSVIAMNEAGMAKLDALGHPSIMIVPHGGHRLDPSFYKARYPELRTVAPAGARAKIEEVVACDATSEEALPPLGVRLHALPGFKHGELAYELDTPGGKLLVVSDVLANDDDAPPGIAGWLMARLGGGIKGRLGVPRMMKMMMLKDKVAARAALAKLAELEDVKVVTVAHGRAVVDRCGEALREGAASI